jgi:hypothetical protein
MGTDWVRLFDKGLCDLILARQFQDFAPLIEPRVNELDEFSEFRYAFDKDCSLPERINYLIKDGHSEADLKYRLIESFCPRSKPLPIDYWACHAEIFVADPPGSIPDLALFLDLKEQRYLLLKAQHVDQMLDSLTAHRVEVKNMPEKQIARDLRQKSWIDGGILFRLLTNQIVSPKASG